MRAWYVDSLTAAGPMGPSSFAPDLDIPWGSLSHLPPPPQVTKAVAALQQYHAVSKAKKKPSLVEENPFVSLIIALKKIPDRTHRRPYFM